MPVSSSTSAAFPCSLSRSASRLYPSKRFYDGSLFRDCSHFFMSGPQVCSPPRSFLPLRLIAAGQPRLLRPSRTCFVASAWLLQLFFRGLLSVHSRYGQHARGVAKRPFPSKAPTALLPPLPLRLLPGGANQFPGGSCTRCSPAPFTAHCFAINRIVSRLPDNRAVIGVLARMGRHASTSLPDPLRSASSTLPLSG